MAGKRAQADPARLEPSQLAAMLSRSGEQDFTEDDIRADIKDGAPANADGTISFAAYSAWLARETN